MSEPTNQTTGLESAPTRSVRLDAENQRLRERLRTLRHIAGIAQQDLHEKAADRALRTLNHALEKFDAEF